MRIPACTTLLAWLAALAPADILHLRDGSRYYGSLVRQDATACVFRVSYGENASAVRTFPASRVARVERSARTTPPEAPTSAAQDATAPDFTQMLREAFELADDDDPAAALAALRRVVRAPQELMPALDRLTRSTRGVALDAWMAGLRMRLALASGKPSLKLLRTPTPFEAVALGEQLRALETQLLNHRYGARDLYAWARHHDEYQELRPDAREMVDSARLAAGLLGVRLRVDPALRDDRGTRATLVSLRSDLVRLGARVRSMPGYTSLGFAADLADPTAETARRLAEEAQRAAAAALDPNAATLDELAETPANQPAEAPAPPAENSP